ncbi:TonB-dependent receptor [Sphingomonas sp. LY54]|uniref:TonB-dependent receptor domain-containing protein n=1 Tax=Sphingomonas sp. LY54 TaxID=3095343 RepID=UPI002D7697F9|nr:TonB-dependent receptor [Sphingomonas sp. LY54]WRP29217.1 TonB-dependent receptor [Sphingomonas sp. LY54]
MFIGATIAVAAPAMAQDTAQDQDPAAALQSEAEIESGQDASGQTITVTGSRIRRPNLESNAPISSLGGEEFFETGQISVGDVLNELPQLRSTFSQQNSTRFLGTRGLNLLDLRGLGTQRTLVLVNGRRHVGGDVLVNAVSPDVNTFPTDLIERVDVITGGGSSIYGSDAIAGVVNFILKDNYEGLSIRGQAGISDRGDAGNQYVSVLGGMNFGADDRGNIAVNLEYAHQDRYFGSGGRGLRQNNNFIVVDTDPAGSVNGADGTPDRTFFRDIRSATISLGGQVGIFQGAANPACGAGGGTRFTCGYLFQPDGTLIPQTGTRVGLGPNGNYIGGNGTTSREGELLTLSPQLDRYAVNVIGHYEITEALVPFVEAKYVRSEAFGSQSGPFFSQGTTLGDPGGRERIRLDNPFLSSQARALLTQELSATTVNPNTGAAFTDTLNPDGTVLRTAAQNLALQRAAIAAGTFRFGVRRNWVDFGIRDEEFVRETYRIVGGLKGNFNDDWNYELSLNYGEHRERATIKGNVNIQRYLLGIDTTVDPATGQIVCRSRLNPAGTVDYGNDAAILAADIAACVPINPFGQGSVTQAARDYVLVDSVATGKIKQFVVSGFVAGDSSQFLELPGGPVGFSVGAEYRRERVEYDLDDLTQAGYAFYNAIPTFRAPAFEVKEVYGEVRIPILADMPFFEELTVTGSGRISDYKGSTGTTYAYGGEVTWRPLQDIRFRGSYNRAVRAPNLVDLFSEQSQNFAPAPNDPCSLRNIGAGSSTREANCRADGIPTNYDFVYTSSIEIVSGGNPNLQEETSDNYTVGAVLTPRWIPGLSVSVDYFDITVNDVITAPSAQQIMNACYDAVDLNNQFCDLFERNRSGGLGPQEEAPFQILQGSLLQNSLNYAKLTARGIDVEMGYRHTFDFGTLGLRTIWTHTLERNEFLNPADPNRANRILSELGDPKNQVNVNADLKVGSVTFGYQMRWIDKMTISPNAEDTFSVQGRAPENADYADRRFYPDVFYHDIRLDAQVTPDFNIYVGVDNVADRLPPLGLTGVGAGSGIYDVRGRYGYVGVKARF